MAARKTGKIYQLHVEVLQNGEVVASTCRAASKPARLVLSNRYDGELSIPFYSGLQEDIELFRISKDGVKLFVDPGWKGFATSGGQHETFSGKERSQRVIALKNEDYGSIVMGSMRVIFKMEPAKRPPAKRPLIRSSEYRNSFLSTWIGGKLDAQTFLLATLAAFISFGGFLYGLAARPDDRPRQFAELKPEYTLPFIHEDHLRHSPEAMQAKLDRSNYIRSTVNYYKAMTSMILGHPHYDDHLMIPNSSQTFRHLHEKLALDAQGLSVKQRQRDDQLRTKAGTAVLKIATVVGEDLVANIHRISTRYALLHETYAETLSKRRAATKLFREIQAYDPTNYRVSRTSEKTAQNFSQINPFVQTSNENVMYQEAEKLASQASLYQQRSRQAQENASHYDERVYSVVTIPGDVDFVSFVSLDEFGKDINDKLAYIQASEFGTPEKVAIREPVIGEIDPALIERVIDQKRYELQLCYELALRRNQITTGSMEWSWRIDTHGRITDLELVASTISDRAMEACVKEKIAQWSFPRPRRGSVEIRYPFSFEPARG